MSAPKSRPTYFYNLHQIWVAHDLGENAQRAFEVATMLARRAEAEVTAAHVIETMPECLSSVLFPYAALGSDEPDLIAELLEHARRRLLELAKEVSDEEIYGRISYGSVLDELKASILSSNAELVVCSAYGRDPGVPGRLGSVASALAASSPRPVLLVKPYGGTQERHFRKILVALDGSEASSMVLNWALSFALSYGDIELEIVTVIPDPRAMDPCGLLAGINVSSEVLKRKGTKRAKQRMHRIEEELYVPFPREAYAENLSMKHHVLMGDEMEQIVALSERLDVDLVVVGSRHPQNPSQSRFGRVAEGVMRLAGCHVLVLPLSLMALEGGGDFG